MRQCCSCTAFRCRGWNQYEEARWLVVGAFPGSWPPPELQQVSAVAEMLCNPRGRSSGSFSSEPSLESRSIGMASYFRHVEIVTNGMYITNLGLLHNLWVVL